MTIFLRLFFASLLLAGFFTSPREASARDLQGDLFADADWSAGNRPRVPSDDARGQDMFPAYPLLHNRNADLFNGLRPRVISTRDDMLSPKPAPVPQGRLFAPWADR